MDRIPSGTVTFLFTDIEDSTRLWQEEPEAMRLAHERHDEILRQAIQSNNGYIFQIVGDSFSAAFHHAIDGLNAALEVQRKLYTDVWGDTGMIKVRMGLHTGTAEILPDGKYDGYTTLATTQRTMSVGCGGQVLFSQVTYELCHHNLPENVTFLDMGQHQLKGIQMPMRLYQLTTPDLPAEFPPIKSLSTVPNNMPAQLTSFIGREKQLTDASEQLGNTRMLTFIGPGGTGKTRLSLQLAENQLSSFKDGAWLVELAPLTDSAYVVSAIASTFKLREVQGVPLLMTLMDYLRGKQLLLILDNCEHLVEACAQLADQLLHECPKLKIVASSREALGINGETVYRVPSLKEDEARLLFIERANKADSRFQATENNVSFIDQICVHLDGIPLAIELAAARVKLFSPQQIAERLDDRFKLLTGGSRTALPRQQTLRALIDWSYQTLNELEQRTLRQLAVFSGGWTFEAAETVVEESQALDGLAGLVNKSLVTVEEHGGASRYSFLETIRQYAMEKLLESGEAIIARDKHFEYFLVFANRVNEQLVNERKKKWFDLLELENGNLRSALRWSIQNDPLKAVQLIWSMNNFWLVGGYLAEGQVWCNTALSRLESYPYDDSVTNLARAHGYSVAAMLSNNQGEHHRARAFLEKAIPVYKQTGDTKELARSLIVLATAFGFSGEIEQAFKTIPESIKISRENGHKFELAWALSTLSYMTSEFHGPAATAEIDAYMQESLALMQEIDHPWGSYYAKEYLSRRAFIQGDIETARKYANEVLASFQEAGATLLANNYKSGMAHVLRKMGNLAEAITMYRETIVVYQDLGHRGAIAHQLENFAFIAIAQQQGKLATKLLGASEALRDVSKSRMTPQEQTEYDKQLIELRAGLDEEDFSRLWAEGRAMSIEQAIDHALKIPISL